MTNDRLSLFRKTLGYQALLLGGVCLLVSVVLVAGDWLTRDVIDANLLEDKLVMLSQVLPAERYDNDPLQESSLNKAPQFTQPVEVMVARAGSILSGTALQISTPGWGGDIQFIMGIDDKGEIIGVRVISHTETPGLADKIEIAKSAWITGFDGRSLANTPASGWAVKKDGGVFDQFVGATITPRSLVKGVYEGLQFHDTWKDTEAAAPLAAPEGE